MENFIRPFIRRISEILEGQLLSVYLYGSLVMDDFQPGWSDIDILCLTGSPLSQQQAEALLMLRQQMVQETDAPLFRAIEGIVVCANDFQNNLPTTLVYWGTSSQRIMRSYSMDAFSRFSLLHFGKCIFGMDGRRFIPGVTFDDLLLAIRSHLDTIRTYAQQTNDSLYSCGWLLDIARCLYTLRHQTIISKTKAGEWALFQGLCPEPDQMEQTLAVRQNPSEALQTPEIRSWLKTLGPSIQKFADVLEKELEEQTNEQMV